MKRLLIVLVTAMSLTVSSAYSQKLKLTKGNLSSIKGEKEMLIEFNYENFAVGKFKNESDYKAKKIEEYNKKEPGRGDKWSESWDRDKEVRFPEKFIELYNKNTTSAKVNPNTDGAKYKMIVITTFIEPGYNVGVTRQPASANMKVHIVEIDNPSTVVAEITITGAPGSTAMGMDFDTGMRISECYAISAKRLAALVNKLLK